MKLGIEHVRLLKKILKEESRDLGELQRMTKLGKKELQKSLSFLIQEEKVRSEDSRYTWNE